jgi:hypothetical protein
LLNESQVLDKRISRGASLFSIKKEGGRREERKRREGKGKEGGEGEGGREEGVPTFAQ